MLDKNISFHNKKLKESLRTLEHDATHAKNTNELLGVLEKFYGTVDQVKYKNDNLLRIFLLSNIFIIFSSLIILFLNKIDIAYLNLNDLYIWALVIFVTNNVLIFGAMYFLRQSSIPFLSKKIFYKSVLFDYGLFRIEPPLGHYFKRYAKLFFEFHRGNHDNEFDFFFQGKVNINNENCDYNYLKYHYVNKEIQTYYDGKTVKTRTVYIDYYRFAVIIDFKYHKNIFISNLPCKFVSYSKYKTVSDKFNKKFKISYDEELEVAKFLQPVIVEEFTKICDEFSKFNLEINGNNQMVLSFANDILNIPKNESLSEKDKFIESIKIDIKIDRFERIIKFIQLINKYCD